MPRGIGNRPAEHYGTESGPPKDLPNYARKSPSEILGKPVSKKFEAWYYNDYQNKGFTTPGLKYQGPGNSTNLGDPVNEVDSFAQKHDLEYAWQTYRFQNKIITQAHYEKLIQKADEEFIKNNAPKILEVGSPFSQTAAQIGTVGIGLKYMFERVSGQQYPSTNQESRDYEPSKNTNLKKTLMKNLTKNVSKSETVEQDGSMVEEGTPVKKAKIGEHSSESPNKPGGFVEAAQNIEAIPEVEMANLVGTGKEQASGGASSDGMMVHTIDRPFTNFGSKITTYRKCHKFMTFGFADKINLFSQGSYALSSYLAEIPWHIPALYLNQSEFDLIPPGSHVVSVNVSATYRGSTVQFDTNESTTQLATLNQINDIAVAHGLNRTGWGSNFAYASFNATQDMIPTSVTRPKYDEIANVYKGMVRDYYGSNNDSADFISDIPKHQTARQTFLYNYWNTTVRGADGSAAAFKMFGGWPCIAEKIQQMDGKTVVNQTVLRSTYKPKFAPIKSPLKMQSHGMPFPQAGSTMTIPVGGNLVAGRQCSIITPATPVPSNSQPIISATAETSLSYANTNTGSNTEPTFSILSPIEKCQMGRSGAWGENDVHVQPSLHIGVQPVPALSSASLLVADAAFNQWTNTRAYWEVTAVMEVREHTPTAWPYAANANVPAGEVVMWIPDASRPDVIVNAAEDGATYAGLYTNLPAFT